ncbi:hypothetical protein AAHA92_19543 [Salvia divinorum]|uniref:Uncharacterized protein n=1 Tax=Salvia divinorum TaxID=28513 RepID=A0ABD1H5P8_SALDI
MDPVHYIQNCFRAIRNWFRHNTVLIKSILLISGLVWSTMMEKTFVRILITPHTGGGRAYDLPSVVAVNLHQGISSVFVLIFTYATGGCLVRFLVVVCSTTASILGLIYYMFPVAGDDDKEQLHLWSFYLAMVVMASAQAALTATLKEALDGRFRPMYHDQYQRQRLTKLLWSPVSLMAAEFAPLEPLTGLHFEKLALVLITVMLFLFCVFLLSSSYNHYAMATGYVRATERRRVEARRPVNLFLLWVCLLILSLVSASASAFFFLEASTFSGRNYLSAILSLDKLLRFTEASFRGIQRRNQETVELLRIGIALLYCVLCCTVAPLYWLAPQFFILGLMVGLAKEGFQSLYESRVSSHLKRYGSALGELARGLGGILSMLCIFVFRGDFSWLEKDVDSRGFNTYCIFLLVLSSFSFSLFLVVAAWYMGGCMLLDDEEIQEHLE